MTSFSKFLIIPISASLTACSVFLPPHPNSNFREGEHVDIEMLTCQQMTEKLHTVDQNEFPYEHGSTQIEKSHDPYNKLFGVACTEATPKPISEEEPDKVREKAIPVVAPLVMAAAGLAIDAVEKKLTEEAALYEAQWSQEIARDDFLKIGKNAQDEKLAYQRYHGFRLCRSVKGIKDGCAMEIIFGMHPSRDQQLMLVGPLAFKTNAAKAKVLSDHWTTFIPPWVLVTAPGKFAKIAGHSIDVDVALDLTAVWRTNNPVKVNSESVGVTGFKVNGYDLENQDTLTPGKSLPIHPVGWTLTPPSSIDAKNNILYGEEKIGEENTKKQIYGVAGTYKIKALVTERDTSNAKSFIEQAKQGIESKKPMILEWVGNQVGTPPANKKQGSGGDKGKDKAKKR